MGYTPTYKVMYGRYFSYEWEIGEYIADGSNEMRMTGGFDECASAARTRGYMYSTMKDSNIWCAGFRHRYINSFSIADWRSKTPSKVFTQDGMRLGDPFYVFWKYSTYIADMRGRNATLPVDGLCYGINDRGDDNNRVCDADDEVSTYTMQIGDTYTLVEVPPISKYECANRIANLALSSSKGIFGFNSGG